MIPFQNLKVRTQTTNKIKICNDAQYHISPTTPKQKQAKIKNVT